MPETCGHTAHSHQCEVDAVISELSSWQQGACADVLPKLLLLLRMLHPAGSLFQRAAQALGMALCVPSASPWHTSVCCAGLCWTVSRTP